jgi:sulfoxide reductase catalytic subunit YedY
MLITTKHGWELPQSAATPEAVYLDRRRLLAGLGAGGAMALAGLPLGVRAAQPGAALYPFERNGRYTVERALSKERHVTSYNNFYEFGSHKNIRKAAQNLVIDGWKVAIDGLVEAPFEIAVEDLLAKLPREERVYRHRCVEAWSMTVPWSGFPLAALVALARPLSAAKYVRFECFNDRQMARGQRQHWFPWPYTEGLTLAEATNELAFIATGLYGKPILKQNGAPLRLVVPWKYGFKSIKSIVRISFTDARPETFWNTINDELYGFWANVNPDVPFPDWSQASERVLGSRERVPTRLYNGYGEFVADLYGDAAGESIFF